MPFSHTGRKKKSTSVSANVLRHLWSLHQLCWQQDTRACLSVWHLVYVMILLLWLGSPAGTPAPTQLVSLTIKTWSSCRLSVSARLFHLVQYPLCLATSPASVSLVSEFSMCSIFVSSPGICSLLTGDHSMKQLSPCLCCLLSVH